MQITPYLFFRGTCKDAFTFYQQVLGGEMQAMMTYSDSPAAGDVSPDLHGQIIHACLALGDFQLMASDDPQDAEEKPQGFRVAIHAEEPAEAERIFNALAEGGTVDMPIAETFWALRFGMLTDKFGTPWMVNCSRPT